MGQRRNCRRGSPLWFTTILINALRSCYSLYAPLHSTSIALIISAPILYAFSSDPQEAKMCLESTSSMSRLLPAASASS